MSEAERVPSEEFGDEYIKALMARVLAGMEERRRVALALKIERARPYLDAAEAKRQRRRERNLRVDKRHCVGGTGDVDR